MSALTLERLAFDPAAAADGPTIGSYVISSGGDVIDSTLVSGKEGLNVNILNDIAVDIDHANDSIKIGDGTDFLAINGDGSINATVTATDLDIRDLVQATDSVSIGDGTTLFDTAVQDVAAGAGHAGFSSMAVQDAALSALASVDGDFAHLRVNANGALWVQQDGDINIADGGNSITVDATDLDIRDLTHVSDSVKIGDGTDFLAVNADGSINVGLTGGVADDAADSGSPLKIGYRAHDASSALSALSADSDRADGLSDLYRRMFINDAPNIAGASNAVSVDTTAGGVALGSGLAGRTRMLIQNNGPKSVFVGFGTVTAANGIEVGKGATLALEAGEAIAVKAIAASGTQDVRVFEMA